MKNWDIMIKWRDSGGNEHTSYARLINEDYAAVLAYMEAYSESDVIDCTVSTPEKV